MGYNQNPGSIYYIQYPGPVSLCKPPVQALRPPADLCRQAVEWSRASVFPPFLNISEIASVKNNWAFKEGTEFPLREKYSFRMV